MCGLFYWAEKMRRVETYVGSQCYEWIDSVDAQNTMASIAKVCAAMFGTTGVVNGLACTPTSPATMAVQIGAGELYQLAPYEATACGTLPANTAYNLLKQGIQLGTYTTATFAAPTTSGQSIAYLVECQYQDSDISLDPTSLTTPVVLQFYNSTTPSSPWSGPNNSGATSNTFRDGVVAYTIKAGVAATTGSQVTPSPDTGWIGLWVVTVPYGATSLTSSNISQYTGAPILPNGILQSIITGNLAYGVDSGTAGVVQAKFPIPVTTLVDGMDVWVKIAAANPATATFTPNPGVISAAPIVGAAHAALQGGELVANGRANFVYRADITSWVLVECTGGALQVAPATASQHAPQMAQVAGVVGGTRNLAMSVTAASASATLTADEIIVETALGGVRYCLPSFSKTINLATTGAGGMDTGTAPVSGFVALYAIYNPTTATSALLATNATSAAAPNVYGGANMPSGYTASALVSVWPTNASSQFVLGYQRDRSIDIVATNFLSISTTVSSITGVSVASIIPKNALRIKGELNAQSGTSGTSFAVYAYSSSAGVGRQTALMGGGSVSLTQYCNYSNLMISTPQTFYYATTSFPTGALATVDISGYDI